MIPVGQRVYEISSPSHIQAHAHTTLGTGILKRSRLNNKVPTSPESHLDPRMQFRTSKEDISNQPHMTEDAIYEVHARWSYTS